MRNISWKRWIGGALGLVTLLVVVALVAQTIPRPVSVADTARRITGSDFAELGQSVAEFRAEYRRWDAVLGVPVQNSRGVVTARRVVPGTLDVTFDLSGFGRDLMRLNDSDLMVEERTFGEPDGPGQSFRRDGMAMDVTVRAADGSTRDLRFTYPVTVFEPSLLEFPFGMFDLAVGDQGWLAWSNFGDEDDHWVPFEVLGEETLAAAGRSFDTRIVRTRFPNGTQRDYWVIDEPPYKVRMVAYQRGKLLTNGWQLESLEIFD